MFAGSSVIILREQTVIMCRRNKVENFNHATTPWFRKRSYGSADYQGVTNKSTRRNPLNRNRSLACLNLV